MGSKTEKVSTKAPLVATSWELDIYLHFIMNCVHQDVAKCRFSGFGVA